MSARYRVLVVLGVVAAAAVLAVVLVRRPAPSAGGPADPFELLPDRCQAVFVVPDPGRLGEHLALLPRLKLADLLSSLAGYPTAEAFLADLSKQAGYDLRSPESMRRGGIDPSRAAVGYLSEREVPLALIPIVDPATFEARFVKDAAARLGAQAPASEKVGPDRTLFVLTAPGPNPQVVAWAYAGGYALLTQGQAGMALLREALAQTATGSLARDPRFAATRARLADRDVFAFSCLDALPLQKQVFMPYGTTFAASLSAQELRLSFALPLDDAWNEKLRSLATPAGADLVAALDPDAFLVGRLGGDPALLAPLAGSLMPAAFQRAFKEGGVDLVADVLKNLKPGVAASLSLAPTARLSGLPALDVRRTNPFDYVRLAAIGRASDPSRAASTLAALAEVAPRFGATLEPTELSGVRVFVTRYHLGEGASIALDKERIVVTGGAGQMQAQLDRLRAPAPAPRRLANAEAARALEEDAFAVWLDLARLTRGVRTLPDSAYGIGGWAIKAALARWLDALDELTGLRASGRLADKTLGVEVAVSLQLAPAPAQAQQAPGANP